MLILLTYFMIKDYKFLNFIYYIFIYYYIINYNPINYILTYFFTYSNNYYSLFIVIYNEY